MTEHRSPGRSAVLLELSPYLLAEMSDLSFEADYGGSWLCLHQRFLMAVEVLLALWEQTCSCQN